jgi:hypothetical protein
VVCFWANEGSPYRELWGGKFNPVRIWARRYYDAATNEIYHHFGGGNDRFYHDMWYGMWLSRLDGLCRRAQSGGLDVIDELCERALAVAGAAARGEPCYGWDGEWCRTNMEGLGCASWLYDDVARVCELQKCIYGLGLVHRLLDPGVPIGDWRHTMQRCKTRSGPGWNAWGAVSAGRV